MDGMEPMTAGGRRPVLHFCADWLPASEVFVYDLVRHLERPGVVVAGNHLVNQDRFPIDDVHSLSTLYAAVRPAGLRPWATTAALSALIRRRGVEVVHAHHGYQLERVVGAVRRQRLPLVVSFHGHDLTGFVAGRSDPYREARPLVSAVVVPSRFLAGHAVATGFDPRVVHVLPSGIDTAAFVPTPLPDGPPTALFVGRFVAKKGLDVLARAWPAVQAAVPGARLRILGYGPLEPVARSISGRVEVVLSPTPAQVRRAMTASRVVVSPSHSAPDDAFETLLMVNVEAQASGRPVVTTRHGGIPEYVTEGETALVVDEHDPEGLARALVAVLADDDLARRLGAAGPGRVAHLDVRRTAAAVDDLYDAVAAAGTPGPRFVDVPSVRRLTGAERSLVGADR